MWEATDYKGKEEISAWPTVYTEQNNGSHRIKCEWLGTMLGLCLYFTTVSNHIQKVKHLFSPFCWVSFWLSSGIFQRCFPHQWVMEIIDNSGGRVVRGGLWESRVQWVRFPKTNTTWKRSVTVVIKKIKSTSISHGGELTAIKKCGFKIYSSLYSVSSNTLNISQAGIRLHGIQANKDVLIWSNIISSNILALSFLITKPHVLLHKMPFFCLQNIYIKNHLISLMLVYHFISPSYVINHAEIMWMTKALKIQA